MAALPPPLPPPLPRLPPPRRRRGRLLLGLVALLLAGLLLNLALAGWLFARHRRAQAQAFRQQRQWQQAPPMPQRPNEVLNRNPSPDQNTLEARPMGQFQAQEGPGRPVQRREGMNFRFNNGEITANGDQGNWRNNRRTTATSANTPTRPGPKPQGPRADQPVISVAGGVFTNAFEVRLSPRESNTVIRYTLNGGTPTTNSPVYSGPLTIREGTLLQARAFQPDRHPSAVATANYTFLDDALGEFSSNLPLVILNSHRQWIGSEDYIFASARFIRPENGRTRLTGPADYEGRGDLKRRGHSSLRLPKASFTFKARDDDGDKAKASIFGLPRESDWVLYAPYADKSLLRDVLAYEMSNLMGRYATRTRFVEVFVNRGGPRLTRDDYVGVYVFEERIKRDSARVNIAKLTPGDNAEPAITGGYILKRDHVDNPFNRWGRNPNYRPANDGENGFTTSRDMRLFFVDPDEKDLTAQQKAWIEAYLNRLEQSIYGPNFTSPTQGYARYLDVDSFIDHHWLVESTKNIDGFRYSCYMTKDRGGKLKLEPAWDWNLSFGNADYYDAWYTSEWYYPLLRDSEVCWFSRLAEDPDFYQRHIDRWAELRTNVLDPDRVSRRVDELAAELQEAQTRNFQRWRILGVEVHPNHFVGDTWQEELDYVKKWFRARVSWIDRQFPAAPRRASPPEAAPAGGASNNPAAPPRSPGDAVVLTARSGQIYYTLDGSDPRQSGGAVAPGAQSYQQPIALPANARLTARTKNGTFWSAPFSLHR